MALAHIDATYHWKTSQQKSKEERFVNNRIRKQVGILWSWLYNQTDNNQINKAIQSKHSVALESFSKSMPICAILIEVGLCLQKPGDLKLQVSKA